MTQPAARLTDLHTHGSGTRPVIGPCDVTVLITGLPSARVTDGCECGSSPDLICAGSMTVLIGGLPAARIGDPTERGGTLCSGEPTVLIGGTTALGNAFGDAAEAGTPLVCKDGCKECGSA